MLAVAGLTERCVAAMGAYGVVALCGTQPPGAESLYERLALSLAHAEPARPLTAGERTTPLLLLDGFKAVEGVLDSGRLDVGHIAWGLPCPISELSPPV